MKKVKCNQKECDFVNITADKKHDCMHSREHEERNHCTDEYCCGCKCEEVK
jgi:hypothetical protein